MSRNTWIAAAVLIVACDGDGCDSGAQLYQTADRAPSLKEDAIAQLDHLGPTLIDDGINFGVYSAHAERIELLLFDAVSYTHLTLPTKA